MTLPESVGELYSVNQLAEYLGLSPRTIMAWKPAGLGPKRIQIGRRVFFKKADVQEWLDAQVPR
jgi:excisionase family DNA binding protein